MAIKVYKPTSNGRRIQSVTDYSVLEQNHKAPKSLTISKRHQGGRNNSGKITVRHRGGGFKKKVKQVDYSRLDKMDVPAKVLTVEYASGRSSFLSLIAYRDGEKRYIIAPHGIKVGDTVTISAKADPRPGNRMYLKSIPVGTFVHDIEIEPGKRGAIARSAGSYATLQAVEGGYALLKMPSNEIRKVSENCLASCGQVFKY